MFSPRLREVLEVEVAGFDWDEGNREKCLSHGVSIAEIGQVFANGEVRISADPRHSAEERRLFAMGSTLAGRSVVVVFTTRSRGGSVLIRPISVRYMHRREVAKHEKDVADPQDR